MLFSLDKYYILWYNLRKQQNVLTAFIYSKFERKIVMVKVNVKNGTLSQEEINAYVQYAIEANPGKLVTELDINLDGDYADLTYHFGEIPFDRIRRITGYLVGTLDRFNNAKKAEVQDRVKHSLAPEEEEDIYVTA